MQLQRSETRCVIFFVKGRAQGIVVLRNFSQGGDLALAAPKMRSDCLEPAMSIRLQNFRERGIASDVDQENDEHDGKETAGNFQHAASAPPAAPLLIIENGLAFRHRDNPS